jgi:tetratricopeptide (TPR) repeat protein
VVNRASVAGSSGLGDTDGTWPVRTGLVPALSPGFVPRPESAPGLGSALVPGRAVVLAPTSAPAPPGAPDWMAACGKTQLAAYLAESMLRSGEIELLAWVTATSEASILAGYAAAAAAALGVGPPSDAEALAVRFIGWLAGTARPWLVVLDNLAGSCDITELWPSGPAGRTLITTNEPEALPRRKNILSFPLSSLSRREALSFLLGRLTEDRGQRTGAIDVVDRLGGEPLALTQVSAVIAESSLSCRDYLDHFERKAGQFALPDHGRSAAAAITWTVSVEQAYRLLPGGPAQPLLILASILDANGIPGPVLTTTAAMDYAGGKARGLAGPQDAWAAVTSLERTGLLSIDHDCTPPVVRLSAPIQTAIRSATSSEMLDKAALAAAAALVEAWPAHDPDTWLPVSLRLCAESVIRLAGDLLWAGADSYRLLFRAGRSLEEARLTRLAARHWSDVAESCKQYLGPGHPDTLEATDRLADAFLAGGRSAAELPWFQQVVAERSSYLGAEHPASIASAIRLGRALLADGLADDAVTVLERALADCSHIRGAGHPHALDAREALASAYCASSQLTEGIRQYQRTLAERERANGPLDEATLSTSLSLGDAFVSAGRIKEALSQFKAVAAGRERAAGPDSPDAITARSRLASAHYAAGRMAAALQMYEQVRADSERVLGVDHPDTLTRRVNLAHAYYAVGRIGDATALLRDTADRCDRMLAPDDQLLRTVHESLANISGD